MKNLAIVIPFYKITFFEDTLKSLKNQTNKQFTVYIGNDAGPEDPSDLLKKYNHDFAFKYKKFDSNKGNISLTKQWERCLKLIGDEPWVMILGDDDKLGVNCVAEFYKQQAEIIKSNANVIRFASKVINEKSDVISKEYFHPNQEQSIDFFIRKSKGGSRSSLSEYVFNKQLLSTIGLRDFPLAWHADDVAVLEVSNFGWIYTINEAFMFFRHSSENITGQKTNLKKKAEASFLFYYYLLSNKAEFFEESEKEVFYGLWEKSFLNIKSKIKFWLYFTVVYIRNGRFKQYVHFLRKAYNQFKPTNK